MIRLGTIADVPIIDLFDPFGDSREKEVSEKRMHVFQDVEGRPVAYISIAGYTLHGFPYVTFLLVHRDHRRKGIATNLLHQVEALHRGKRMFISTESDNQEMLALLKKENYRLSGVLNGLNDDHGGAGEVFFFKDV